MTPETIALCLVLFDWEGVRVGYLPATMAQDWIEQVGVDLIDIDTASQVGKSLSIAVQGDADRALDAVRKAETQMWEMTPAETREAVLTCGKDFAFLADD